MMQIIEIVISFIVFVMILSTVSIIPPVIGRKRYWITWWDYTYPFLGPSLWFILRKFDVGDEISMTNFMFEIFLIMLTSTIVPWIRYYLAYSKARFIPHISFLITLLPAAAAACLRLFVPLLPV